MMGSEPKESSKELLVLEHTSEDARIEKLLGATSTKPKIERLSSSVLQRVQQFLPELHDANEKIDGESNGELCCEVGEGFDGPAIEMTLMVTHENDDQKKMVEVLETDGERASTTDSDSDSSGDSDSSSTDVL